MSDRQPCQSSVSDNTAEVMAQHRKKVAMYKELKAIDIDSVLAKAEEEVEELADCAFACQGMLCALRQVVVEADPSTVPDACKRIRHLLNEAQTYAEKAINHLSVTKPLEQHK